MNSAALHAARVVRASPPPSAVAHGHYLRTRFFSSLDGLRALSILAVIWHHTAAAGAANTLLHQGNQGVSLFFVISGFLIVTLLLRAKARSGTFSLPKFWGRRTLRILPVYYGVLGLYVVLVVLLEHNPGYRRAFFGNLPAFATFTSNWFVSLKDPRVIFYFAWSLAAEEQFYLVWPWFERYLRGAWPLFAALIVLALTQGTALAVHSKDLNDLSLPVRMISSVPAAILLGVILAHLLHSPGAFRVLYAMTGRRGSATAAFLLTVAALGARPVLGPARDFVTAAAMMLLVASCVVREDNDLMRLLSAPWIAWVGKVSYGMYLLHMLSVNQVRRALAAVHAHSPYLDFIFGTLLAIGAASLSYLFFESRFLRLKDRLFREDLKSVQSGRV